MKDMYQCFPSLLFAMSVPSRSFLPPSLLHLSLEHICYIDTSAILPILLPTPSKKKKRSLCSTTCSLQTHSASHILLACCKIFLELIILD